MRLFGFLAVFSLFTFPAISNEEVSSIPNPFTPVFELENRCLLLSKEEREDFFRLYNQIELVLEDALFLGISLDSLEDLKKSVSEITQDMEGLDCGAKALRILEDGKKKAKDFEGEFIFFYLDRQRTYMLDAYAVVVTSYFLSLRCPDSTSENLEVLHSRFHQAKKLFEVLVGSQASQDFMVQAEDAVSEEKYGPCGEKARNRLIHALENSNLLVSRLNLFKELASQ